MHAYLIIGPDQTERTAYIETVLSRDGISSFDRIYATGEPSIGIAEIRQFIKRLSLSPSDGTMIAGIIAEGNLLTQESQHALLKTLEEPPRSCRIYIGISHADALLPTITSRCQNIYLTAPDDTVERDNGDIIRSIHAMLTMTPGYIVSELSKIGKTKEDHGQFIMHAISALRKDMISQKTGQTDGLSRRSARLLHNLLDAVKYQANNVSPLLLLEHALFTS